MTKSKGTKVTDRTKVTVRLGNLLAVAGLIIVAAYGYAGLMSRISAVESDLLVDQAQIEANTEFRVRWPRGELGRLPDDVAQDLRLQFLEAEVRRLRDTDCTPFSNTYTGPLPPQGDNLTTHRGTNLS